MKTIIFSITLLLSVGSFAQSTVKKDDVDVIQELYGKPKYELVKQYMKLTGDTAVAFWKKYDEYEIERKSLGQKKIQLIADYAENLARLTDEQADKIATESLANNIEYEKLFAKYYEQVKKVIGARNAARFIQLEIYMQTTVRSEVQDAIPFIGELESAKPHKH